jgi:hypothetical protein
MRRATRLVVLACSLPLVSSVAFAQVAGIASVAGPTAKPGYAQVPPVRVGTLPEAFSPNSLTFDAKTGALVSGGAGTARIARNISSNASQGNDDGFDIDERRPNLPTIDGLNTLATFDGAFVAQAGPEAGGDFRFTMVGNDPRLGGTTVYPANIGEVALQLLDADGKVSQTVSYAPFEHLTLESPNFEPLDYASGHQIEYADGAHRAEFYNVMKSNWHTLLIPKVVNKVTVQIPYYVYIQLSDGTVIQARAYFTGKAPDGSTYVLMLDVLFNFLYDNEVVNEINLGNFTTNGFNISAFPNTYLFSLNVNNPNQPGSCCTLGYHTYFLDGVFPESRWVTEYVSWISPGLFGAGFEDVTALSHETSESVDDPFVDNPTPNWQFPGQPANSTVCQNNLEVGDPIEVLANATAAITVKEHDVNYTYHPQNIVLYPWFEMGTTSSALKGAFSFPNPVLTKSAVPCPQ